MGKYTKPAILAICLTFLAPGILLQADTTTDANALQLKYHGTFSAAGSPDREIDYAQILEDTDIMAKIIDKTLEKKWPKKYEPSTMFRQSLGCQGVYLKGYGVVQVLPAVGYAFAWAVGFFLIGVWRFRTAEK